MTIEEKMQLKVMNKKGKIARIKEYRTYHDIDIIFLEDGAIREHIDYKNFIRGSLHIQTILLPKKTLLDVKV